MTIRSHPKPSSQKRYAFQARLIIAVSIPVYLALAGLLYFCWPGLTLLALIPLCFAAHSAGYLMSGRKE